MSIYALALDGWDELSTWGYDSGIGSFYAQLTRNGQSDDNGPEIWITPGGRYPIISTPSELATTVATEVGAELPHVHAAMNDAIEQGPPESMRLSPEA